MTTEIRTTLEPTDVLTIEIECIACGARIVRLIGDYRGRIYGCTNCNASWEHLAGEFKQITQLVGILRFFAVNELPFKLRFEIAGKEQI